MEASVKARIEQIQERQIVRHQSVTQTFPIYDEMSQDIDDLLSLVKSQEAGDSESLHLAICQAVHLMNQGDLHAGHDLLRQTLIDYADKKAPLTRSEIVRQQQQSGSGEITTVMISPHETPYCNPCQSYHSKSQPCFDAATAPRRNAPIADALPQSKAYQDAATVEAKLESITSTHYRTLELMNWKLNAATSMRSACVEKVKAMADEWNSDDRYGRWYTAAHSIASQLAFVSLPLETLSIEKPKE